jgi:hypothetical protein
MRFSLDSALLLLALANTLIDPVDALPTHAPKRHLLKRATDGFHKTALRHSAGLAQDLRVALRGLGVSSPARRSVTDAAAYCIPKPKTNSNTTTTSSSSHSATSTSKGPSSVTSSSTPSSTAQSNWQLAQDYVRLNFYFRAPLPPAREFF